MEHEGDVAIGDLAGMLEEPDGYKAIDTTPAPPPVEWARPSGAGTLNMRLIRKHSLWAHVLWNGARFAGELFDNTDFCKGKSVADIGAGAGLTSIVAALAGARVVACTDYPESDILDNLVCESVYLVLSPILPPSVCVLETEANMAANLAGEGPCKAGYTGAPVRDSVHVVGLKWGCRQQEDEVLALNTGQGYDILMLCDLMANHFAHADLLSSTARLMAPDGVALVAFTHHRPWLVQEDLNLFKLAPEYGLAANTRRYCGYRLYPSLFRDDPGSLLVRCTLHVWTLQHQPDSGQPPIPLEAAGITAAQDPSGPVDGEVAGMALPEP
eukprot:gene4086-743_t